MYTQKSSEGKAKTRQVDSPNVTLVKKEHNKSERRQGPRVTKSHHGKEKLKDRRIKNTHPNLCEGQRLEDGRVGKKEKEGGNKNPDKAT